MNHKHKHTKAKRIFIFVLIFSFLLAVPNQQLTLANVHVCYAENDAKIAEISAKVVSEQQQRLGRQYKLTTRPLHIYIADNAKTYNQYSGTSSPVWSVGLASDDRMLVKSPSFSRQTLKDFQQTLLHETVHLAVEGIPLPVWFNEGFAQYEAGEFTLHKRVLVSREFWHQDLMSFGTIENLMQMPQAKAEIAYAQSVAMVDYLIEYFGIGLVSKCLLYAGEYQDFEKGFQNAFLMDTQRFQQHWRQHAIKSYRLYILLDQQNLIWIIAPILLIIGFILTRIRRKKILKGWEENEVQEPADDP